MSKNKQTIPGFTLKKKLGAGGMGSVYKAVQQSLDREVAIKVMPIELAENPEFRERFFREAKAAGRLNHPNIVQGIDAGEAGPYCWIAMELVNGPSVADLLKEQERFSEAEALAVVTDIARALEHAASHGITHRDVKPENFLRAADGVTKLCDLGIAKAAAEDTGLTQEGRAVGTPRYISPEQARGEQNIDARADIYSLGASWYHLLTGQPPFDGPTAAVVMTKHITDEPEPIQDLVDELSPHTVRVIARMMAKDKEKRYPGLAELLVDLEALGKGELPRGALAAGVGGGASRSKRRRPKGERKGGGKAKGENTSRNTRAATGTGKTGVNRAAGRAGGKTATRTTSTALKRAGGKESSGPPVWAIAAGGGALLLVGIIIAVTQMGSDNGTSSGSGSTTQRPVPQQPAPRPELQPTPRERQPSPDREEQAEKAWGRLQKDLERKSPAFHPDMYEDFAETWKGTRAAERAEKKLAELDAEFRAFEQRQINQAYQKLIAGDYGDHHNLEAAGEAFLQQYPNAPQAQQVRNMIRDYRERQAERAADRRRYVGLSMDYPDHALKTLESVAKGNDNALVDDIRPFLKHRQRDLRAAALKALRTEAPDVAVEAAVEAAGDRNEAVRETAVEILSQSQTQAAQDALVRLAEDDLSPKVRGAARKALDSR